MYHTFSDNVRTAWESVRGTSTTTVGDDLDSAERGEANEPEEPDEKTSLLSRSTTSSSEDSQPSRWSFHLPQMKIFTILYGAMLAPVYSVLIFLPMLPFWIFAGFLIYLLGTSTCSNFYVYLAALCVLLPYNVIGTTYMVRRVWQDMYGE